MENIEVHPKNSTLQTWKIKNPHNTDNQRKDFVNIPLGSNQEVNPNIGDDVTHAQNLKFELSCFEQITGKIANFILNLTHIHETQNKKEYSTLQDLKLAKTNCQTTTSKIQFNEDVDHFVSDRISNPSKYIV